MTMSSFVFTEPTRCPECGCQVASAEPVIQDSERIEIPSIGGFTQDGAQMSALTLLPCRHSVSTGDYEVFVQVGQGAVHVSLMRKEQGS